MSKEIVIYFSVLFIQRDSGMPEQAAEAIRAKLLNTF
jgi:hypothetical protein